MKNKIENITKLNNCIKDAKTKRLMNFQEKKEISRKECFKTCFKKEEEFANRFIKRMLQTMGKIYGSERLL